MRGFLVDCLVIGVGLALAVLVFTSLWSSYLR
jgi:hypothetical protein